MMLQHDMDSNISFDIMYPAIFPNIFLPMEIEFALYHFLKTYNHICVIPMKCVISVQLYY